MIYAFEQHDQLLTHWRRKALAGIRLAHVDFHDDLRGLLIDRRRGRAYAIGALARNDAPVDAGNFLAHAVTDRRVDAVRWVHGTIGGRAWDLGIVRYESDLFALPQRLRHRLFGGTEYALAFEELSLDRWSGPAAGELLSIDWDCFASTLLDGRKIQTRVARFLERLGSVVPQETYVVYSPEYSHPSLEQFGEFVSGLSRRLNQDVEWLSPGLREGRIASTTTVDTVAGGRLDRLALWLRRRGVF